MSNMGRLTDAENPVAAAIEAAEDVRDPLEGLVERTATDPGGPFAPDTLARLATLKKDDRAAFEALRAQLKGAGMTLWRWIHDDKLNFPPPVYIGRFRYWRLSDLIVWERSRTPRGEPAARASAAQSMTTAEAITAALGGRLRANRGGMVRCRERRGRS